MFGREDELWDKIRRKVAELERARIIIMELERRIENMQARCDFLETAKLKVREVIAEEEDGLYSRLQILRIGETPEGVRIVVAGKGAQDGSTEGV